MNENLDQPSKTQWLLILILPFVGTFVAITASVAVYMADIGG